MGIPRRTFLVSSLGSAGLLLPGTVRSALGAIPNALNPYGNPAARMRIGYLEGSEALPCLAEMTHSADGYVDALNRSIDAETCSALLRASIVDATGLSGGDPEFAPRGALLRVHGIYRTPGMRMETLPSLDIYAQAKPFQPIPFHAWSVDAGEAPSCGPSNEIRLPIAQNHGLTLSLNLRGSGFHGSPDGLTPLDEGFYANHVVIRFGLDHLTGGPKLRRGIYLVAWNGAESACRPSWAGYAVHVARIDADEHPNRSDTLCSCMATSESLVAEPQAYVLLTVDYATGSNQEQESVMETHQWNHS